MPVAYSNYGAVDIYVLDVYGASESEPPIIIERLNTEANTVRLPSGIEANLSEIVSSSNFTDGTQVVDMDGTALQGLTLYATGANGDWREENTTLCWTGAGWQVASSTS